MPGGQLGTYTAVPARSRRGPETLSEQPPARIRRSNHPTPGNNRATPTTITLGASEDLSITSPTASPRRDGRGKHGHTPSWSAYPNAARRRAPAADYLPGPAPASPHQRRSGRRPLEHPPPARATSAIPNCRWAAQSPPGGLLQISVAPRDAEQHGDGQGTGGTTDPTPATTRRRPPTRYRTAREPLVTGTKTVSAGTYAVGGQRIHYTCPTNKAPEPGDTPGETSW